MKWFCLIKVNPFRTKAWGGTYYNCATRMKKMA
jgi:hypothetical protein